MVPNLAQLCEFHYVCLINHGELKQKLLTHLTQVFEKAQRCKKDNEGRDVLVVVVLDEVGLAEVSSHNPLKV
jgi:hypothetical protein